MGRALPRVDASQWWPRCGRPGCGATHLPEFDCPPTGVWLVARFCPACTGLLYCRRHSAWQWGRPVLTLVRPERKTEIAGRSGVDNPGPGDHDDCA